MRCISLTPTVSEMELSKNVVSSTLHLKFNFLKILIIWKCVKSFRDRPVLILGVRVEWNAYRGSIESHSIYHIVCRDTKLFLVICRKIYDSKEVIRVADHSVALIQESYACFISIRIFSC